MHNQQAFKCIHPAARQLPHGPPSLGRAPNPPSAITQRAFPHCEAQKKITTRRFRKSEPKGDHGWPPPAQCQSRSRAVTLYTCCKRLVSLSLPAAEKQSRIACTQVRPPRQVKLPSPPFSETKPIAARGQFHACVGNTGHHNRATKRRTYKTTVRQLRDKASPTVNEQKKNGQKIAAILPVPVNKQSR